MYQEHPLLKAPEENDLLWRFIDLSKFVSLIDEKALFFASPRVFDDPFEGHFPKDFYDKMKKVENSLVREHNLNFLRWSAEINQQHHCVSCWHRASHESAAMWKLYSNLRGHGGLAITSSFKNFKKSFEATDVPVSGGLVKYIDYEIDTIEEFNLLVALILKRKSFEHEKEFRAIVMGEIINDANLKRDNGYYIPVNVDTLINEVYIGPSEGPDFKEVVQALLHKYGYTKNVIQSKLDGGPTYIQ